MRTRTCGCSSRPSSTLFREGETVAAGLTEPRVQRRRSVNAPFSWGPLLAPPLPAPPPQLPAMLLAALTCCCPPDRTDCTLVRLTSTWGAMGGMRGELAQAAGTTASGGGIHDQFRDCSPHRSRPRCRHTSPVTRSCSEARSARRWRGCETLASADEPRMKRQRPDETEDAEGPLVPAVSLSFENLAP